MIEAQRKPRPYRIDFEGTLFVIEKDGKTLEIPEANFPAIDKVYKAHTRNREVVVMTRKPKNEWEEHVERYLLDHGVLFDRIARKPRRKAV